jgi:hypothetical protein
MALQRSSGSHRPLGAYIGIRQRRRSCIPEGPGRESPTRATVSGFRYRDSGSGTTTVRCGLDQFVASEAPEFRRLADGPSMSTATQSEPLGQARSVSYLGWVLVVVVLGSVCQRMRTRGMPPGRWMISVNSSWLPAAPLKLTCCCWVAALWGRWIEIGTGLTVLANPPIGCGRWMDGLCWTVHRVGVRGCVRCCRSQIRVSCGARRVGRRGPRVPGGARSGRGRAGVCKRCW